MKFIRMYSPVLLLMLGVLLSACTSVNPLASDAAKRQKVMTMHDTTLLKLYDVKPNVSSLIENAPGYAVFSDSNVNVIFASFSGGYGVAVNNITGNKTFMKMGEAGVGLGFGLKNFREVIVFHDEATMNRFVNNGWQFGGHADAAAILNEKGEAIGGEILIGNMTIYQLTTSGLAFQATVKGTKYWKDKNLNQY